MKKKHSQSQKNKLSKEEKKGGQDKKERPDKKKRYWQETQFGAPYHTFQQAPQSQFFALP